MCVQYVCIQIYTYKHVNIEKGGIMAYKHAGIEKGGIIRHDIIRHDWLVCSVSCVSLVGLG